VRVSATAKYLRASTRKTRLVTQAIKGKPVEEAAALLRFMPQKAAADVARVLKSATADEGPTIKRFQPRAQGRAFPIHKPMTHITIVVADQEA
jgi:large subunit ribosomal protein L22